MKKCLQIIFSMEQGGFAKVSSNVKRELVQKFRNFSIIHSSLKNNYLKSWTQVFMQNNGPNHLLLAMLQTFVWQHCQWHCLQNLFCLKLSNSVRNEKKLLEAMPLPMLPTKSLQHCQDQMIRAIVNYIRQS